jgi:hypothetical protein
MALMTLVTREMTKKVSMTRATMPADRRETEPEGMFSFMGGNRLSSRVIH